MFNRIKKEGDDGGVLALRKQPFCDTMSAKQTTIKSYMKFSNKEKYNIVIDSIAVLIGDRFSNNQKRAALLLLKAFLPHKVIQDILYEDGIYPFDRNDKRGREWTKAVLKRGKCERCGSKNHLEAHHVILWCDYPKGRIDINNGECLCHDCHTKEHENDKSYHMMKARYK